MVFYHLILVINNPSFLVLQSIQPVNTLSRRRCGHGGAVVVCEKVEHLGSGSALIMMMMCTAVAMQRRYYVHSTHVWIRRKQSKI